MLPTITGARLRGRPVTPIASPPAGSAAPAALSIMASGMKYMFAMECSKPAATKAEIGNTIATSLSTTLRPANAIHMPKHTSALHSTPRKNASLHGSVVLAAAMLRYGRPIAPLFISV